MANTDSPMHNPQSIANTFVDQYYSELLNRPASSYKLYQDKSLVSFQKINDMIVAEDYKGCEVERETIEAQASHSGGIIVVVTGIWRGRDTAKSFSQTFFLAPQEDRYYVLNDILKYTKEPEALKQSEVKVSCEVTDVVENVEQDSLSQIQDSPVETSQVETAQVEDFVEDVEAAYVEAIESTQVQDDTSPVSESPESSIVDPTEDYVVPAPKEKVVASTPTAVEAVCELTEEVPKKFSYASMAAKQAAKSGGEAPANRVVVVAHSSSHYLDKMAPAKPKSNRDSVVVNKLKALTNKNAKVDNKNIKGRDIFIANLPKGATVEQVHNVFKRFGPITKGGVQVRRYEDDDFYYGFVEFESAESADAAIAARHITVGEKEVNIKRKKPAYGYRNNNGGGNGGGNGNGVNGGGNGNGVNGRGNGNGVNGGGNGNGVNGGKNGNGVNGGRGRLSSPDTDGGAGYNGRSPSSDSGKNGYQEISKSNDSKINGDYEGRRYPSARCGFQNHGYNNNRGNFGEVHRGRQQNRNHSSQVWVQNNKGQDSNSKSVVIKESDAPSKVTKNSGESIAP